ncbi:TetR/AcrR family transcriptional regulator [Streptosporangium sp. NBC_01755]|uniref:TetR/AcrR family transcriptional regulator n=1 Tax=unclassified Streptosporangium TaxID=2632669 RepID=UPI002DD9D8FB|nr:MULTISPECIES: helix-turn-helix domain-containing protein [unclassified Streptosporangium]WSA26732.1 TetR/AcrR family transcriptional regulator [Streptosporangium sp. NBC_01810]WSD01843.1 TetR/AcrR family transcriptional regulator [Streptosporangium sp. NBC_01755]
MSDVNGRNRRSAQTRLRIVEAAHRLFVTHGYTGTTFQEIADAAGVSAPTVYFHYGNKGCLLKHVVDVASMGDDEPVPLLERPRFVALKAAPDPATAIRRWVHESGVILGRVAPVLAVVRDAAASDADMAAQCAQNSEERRTAHSTFVAVLAGLTALRPGLTRRRATDITVALLSPDLFLVMTRECAWTTKHWESWVTDQLAHALLPDP